MQPLRVAVRVKVSVSPWSRAHELVDVSIGMPTYNGERFIAQALDSLLAQDDGDFELVVSDNASTDRTGEIVRAYAARDERIRYIRQPVTVGAAENFRRAFAATTGSRFMWAADHDLWSPNYLSASMRWLAEYPGTVLAFPETVIIDADGVETDRPPSTPPYLSDQSALRRYRRLMWKLVWGNMIYGLIRREALERTTIGRPLIGADHLVLAELALQGPFQQAVDATFYRREWRDETTEAKQARRIAALQAVGGYRALRNAHLGAVARSELSLAEKGAAAVDTVRCFRSRFGVYL